jgi:hypothetical protein
MCANSCHRGTNPRDPLLDDLRPRGSLLHGLGEPNPGVTLEPVVRSMLNCIVSLECANGRSYKSCP